MSETAKLLKEIASKWRKVWEEKKVYEVDADPSKPKFFITAAFMYPNSPAHMGHGRTYVIADILARFKRLQGYNVLFPMGFHYTGTPIIAMAERIAAKDPVTIRVFRERYDVPEDVLEKMRDPLFLARYFHEVSKEVYKAYGLSIDWRREFTTIDPEFRAFIHWQFRKLAAKGFVEQGTHPVGWCPRHQMPVGMHDTEGDVEPEIGEFVAILFRDPETGECLPTATLRPETIFGVTNIWINPDAKYVKIRLSDGTTWIVGKEASERLAYQMKFEVVEEIDGRQLIGKVVENPITGERVAVLPAPFVDPSFATGVVMSVPAHAPYDAAALEDLKKSIDKLEHSLRKAVEATVPRQIIEVPEIEGMPAYTALKKYGIETQLDRDKLEEATKWVYSTELSRGYMIRDLHTKVPAIDSETREFIEKNVSGKSVSEARENVKEFLLKRGRAKIVYELINKPVRCRCGAEVVVKVLENQWFLNYGNEEWKKLAREFLRNARIVPEEARAQFEATIEWLKRRACARTRGLGVPLPWDPTWIIESLSDSTIYMAFYTVIHKIRRYGIPSEKLTDEFWDYVMLGIGDPEDLAKRLGIPREALEDIRREFDYWYPLDWRVSGKDLIPNHLTFFIFNHAAIFPREKWPRGIIANGWVLLRGGKMSKSRGNIVLLKDLVESWSPDTTRLSMIIAAEVPQDFEITDDLLNTAMKTIENFMNTVDKLYRIEVGEACNRLADRWFLAEFSALVQKITEAFENVKLREAAITVFYGIRELIDRYLSMVDKPCREFREVIESWIKMASPFIPFVAEELWHRIGKETLVVIERWPSPQYRDPSARLAMKFVDALIDDVKNIVRVLGVEKPKRLVLYVYPREAYRALRIAIERGEKGMRDMVSLLRELGIPGDKAANIAKRMVKIVRELDPETRELAKETEIDEVEVLNELKSYLVKTLGVESLEVYLVNDVSAPDLGNKKFAGTPLRPGIYIE